MYGYICYRVRLGYMYMVRIYVIELDYILYG